MTPLRWPCPAPGGSGEEFALEGEATGATRLLIVPALFEEANKTRRMLVEAMRGLATRGIASVLPDLPGCNESLAPLERQTLDGWRDAMTAAAAHFGATHILSLRAGALVVPALPGWRVAPISGAAALRQLLRARLVASRETGRSESTEGLLATGRERGLELAGYRLGAAMIAELERAEPPDGSQVTVTLGEIGGGALWLKGEPGEDAAQSQALTALVAAGIER